MDKDKELGNRERDREKKRKKDNYLEREKKCEEEKENQIEIKMLRGTKVERALKHVNSGFSKVNQTIYQHTGIFCRIFFLYVLNL